MTVTPPPPDDVYPGPLRRFLAAVAGDHVVERWWREGLDPAKGKFGDLWEALGPGLQGVLQRGNLDEIKQAIDNEARKYPKPGGQDVSALGQNWALVRV